MYAHILVDISQTVRFLNILRLLSHWNIIFEQIIDHEFSTYSKLHGDVCLPRYTHNSSPEIRIPVSIIVRYNTGKLCICLGANLKISIKIAQ